MIREPIAMLWQPARVEHLDGLSDPGMKGPALLMEEAAIDDLMRQSMLEGVPDLWKGRRVVEKLRGS
jgi:hypothetical protein